MKKKKPSKTLPYRNDPYQYLGKIISRLLSVHIHMQKHVHISTYTHTHTHTKPHTYVLRWNLLIFLIYYTL